MHDIRGGFEGGEWILVFVLIKDPLGWPHFACGKDSLDIDIALSERD